MSDSEFSCDIHEIGGLKGKGVKVSIYSLMECSVRFLSVALKYDTFPL